MTDADPRDGPEDGQPSDDSGHLVNYEVEQALVAALLADNALYSQVGGFLQPEHLADPMHRYVYSVIRTRCARGELADAGILAPLVTANVEGVDGAKYLRSLQDAPISLLPTSVREWGRAIQKLAIRRSLRDAGEDLIAAAAVFDAEDDVGKIIETHDAGIMTLAAEALDGTASGPRRLGAIVRDDVLPEIERRAKNPDALWGVTTGYRALDAKTGGYEAPDLIVLAGRTSMGKTTVLTNGLWRLTQKGEGALLFSLEMAARQISTRILAERADLSYTALTKGHAYDMHGQFRIGDAQEAIDKAQLWIDDRPALSVHAMHATAKRLMRETPISVIGIDQLGFIQPLESRAPRYEKIGQTMKGLRTMAKDLGVPIILLHQISRASLQQGDDKRPKLEHLRESGDIEQDADMVLFVHRLAYYMEREKPEGGDKLLDWQAEYAKHEGKVDIIIAKQRNGPIGSVQLAWNGGRMRVEDLEAHHNG